MERQTKNQTQSLILPLLDYSDQAPSLPTASGDGEIKCPCGFAAGGEGENDMLVKQRQGASPSKVNEAEELHNSL